MKRFLAALLAVALIITGLYPTQLVNAQTISNKTTTTNDGLEFWTPEYDYYSSNGTFGSTTPQTFEATVRVTSDSTNVFIPGYFMGNTDVSGNDTKGDGFAFGMYKRCIPELTFIQNNQTYTYYFPPNATDDPNSASMWGYFVYENSEGLEHYVHVTVVNNIEANSMSLYLNGGLVMTREGTCFQGTLEQNNPLVIGSDDRFQRSKSFKGDIKNVAIFSDARTEEEIKADSTAARDDTKVGDYTDVVSSTDGLMAAYQLGLEDGATMYPATLTDLSGSNNTMYRNKRLIEWEEKKVLFPRQSYDYSMAVIGDPQVLVAHDEAGDSYPEGGDPLVVGQAARQFQWLVDNKDAFNIQWAFNMGDTTDSYWASGETEEQYNTKVENQWDIGSAAVKKLDGNIPYSIIRGNHDDTENYLEHFAWSDYSSKVSGSYEENMLNTYQKFEVEGIKYMVVNLDLGVAAAADGDKADKILKWANDVVIANPDYNVIVTTHAYLDPDGTKIEDSDASSLKRDGATYNRAKNGSDIWDQFIKQHKNIVMVLSGHRESTGIVRNEAYGVHGNKIMEFMINPQGEDATFFSNMYKENESDSFYTMTGNVAMLLFSDGGKTVQVEYISTLWNSRYYDENSQFTFTLNQVDTTEIAPTDTGLNFWKEYKGYYQANDTEEQIATKYSKVPSTFEATIWVDRDDDTESGVWRPGFIVSNTDCSSEKTKGDGFGFGFGTGHVPHMAVVKDGKLTDYLIFRDQDTTSNDYYGYGGVDYKTTFSNGEWVHITIVNDVEANEVRAYANGQYFGKLTNHPNDSSGTMSNVTGAFAEAFSGLQNQLIIGGDYRAGNNQRFHGNIKNVALYYDVRTPEEVAADYERAKTILPTSIKYDDNLIGAWNLGKTYEGYYPMTIEDLSENACTLSTHSLVQQNSHPHRRYDGLNFWTSTYGPYTEHPALNSAGTRDQETNLDGYLIPNTFEATVRIGVDADGTGAGRGGTIIGTYSEEWFYGGWGIGFNENNRPHIFATKWDSDGIPYVVWDVEFLNTEGGNYTCNRMFRTGAWAHLAIVIDRDAGQMHCYINGLHYATVNEVLPFTTSQIPFSIGGDYRHSNWNKFKGEIRDVTIFSDARTAEEVYSDYKNGITGSEDGCVGAYKLEVTYDDAQFPYPQVLEDQSSLGNNLYRLLTEDEAKVISGRTDYDYSMAIVGDPQVLTAYTANGKAAWQEATTVDRIFSWILDNKDSRNIQYVFNMGDTSDNYNLTTEQEQAEWEAGSSAIKLLDGKIPYSVVRGNHDDTEEFTKYFYWSDYRSAVSGAFEWNMLNTFYKFEIQGIKYMVVTLDFGVAAAADGDRADEILDWANRIVKANPDYNVIVSTHAFLDEYGNVISDGSAADLKKDKDTYRRAKNPQEMWDEFIKLHENIVMVVGGHVEADEVIMQEAYGDNGNKVIQLAVNMQEADAAAADRGRPMYGGVAMLYFAEGGSKVYLENYSTIQKGYYNHPNLEREDYYPGVNQNSQFSFTLDLVETSDNVYDKDSIIALPYSQVDQTGDIPVPADTVDAKYQDYLFAGWFVDSSLSADKVIKKKSEVTETSYAKFIPAEILSVKAQASNGKAEGADGVETDAMRFISSVESLDYYRVGFRVTYEENGETVTKTSRTRVVYRKIISSNAATTCGFSPDVITELSNYFITVKLAVPDAATTYTIQSYHITWDKTTVYGPERVVSLNDANGQSINTVVRASGPMNDTYTATYGINGTENEAGTVTILSTQDNGYTNLRIAIPDGVGTLPSATEFIIKDSGGNTVVSQVYRNYYTTHETGVWDEPYADTTWYDINPDADEFIIATGADLFGLAKLVGTGSSEGGGLYFEGKTIKLISDVTISEGQAIRSDGTTAASWQASGTNYWWRPIGDNWASNCFDGTFDGCGNSISGVCIEQSGVQVGFFRGLGSSAVLKNLSIINSYITNDYRNTGAFVGQSTAASLENLYTDAVLVNTLASTDGIAEVYAGGIVGGMEQGTGTATGATLKMTGCWFDGQLNVNTDGRYIGGLAGMTYNSDSTITFDFTDSLFTGEIVHTGTSESNPVVGGLVGESMTSAKYIMKNCMSMGTISISQGNKGYTGGLVGSGGLIQTSSTITNCYALTSTDYTDLIKGVTFTLDDTKVYFTDKAGVSVSADDDIMTLFTHIVGQDESSWICNPNLEEGQTDIPVLKKLVDIWTHKNSIVEY